LDAAELVTAIRTSAFLPTTDPVFTDARLRLEATEALHTIVERAVVNARSGYWLKKYTVTTVAGKTRYRVPHRSIAGTAEAIRLGDGTFEGDHKPPTYRWLGDHIEFAVAPDAGQTLTIEYYLRPSRLVETQTAGRITAIDAEATEPFVTVDSIPSRRLGASPGAITASDLGDIAKPNGWHELCVVGADIKDVSGNDITFVAGTDLSDVEIGDYVRAADETDWPCLPVDFHRTLADITAAQVLTSKGLNEKADSLRKQAGPALERLQDLLTPRVKNDPPAIVPSVGVLRSRGARYRSLPR
jgi:hypothetical protein